MRTVNKICTKRKQLFISTVSFHRETTVWLSESLFRLWELFTVLENVQNLQIVFVDIPHWWNVCFGGIRIPESERQNLLRLPSWSATLPNRAQDLFGSAEIRVPLQSQLQATFDPQTRTSVRTVRLGGGIPPCETRWRHSVSQEKVLK